MTIVESTVWIDFLRNTSNEFTEWLARNLGSTDIGLTDLIFCEVLRGIDHEATYLRTRDYLLNLPVFNTGGIEVAAEAAENYRLLRAKGFTVRKTVDCVIATFCIRKGFNLLHHDRDYEPFAKHLKLSIVDPLT